VDFTVSATIVCSVDSCVGITMFKVLSRVCGDYIRRVLD
jgi:hypothetical protein